MPLPARAKKHPPKGTTGRDAGYPSYPDCHAWSEDMPDGNIALRLPPGVIGIDVDHYDGKDGGGNLQTWVDKYGELPPTWRTGSRTDGISGIRLYRVPVGLRWPGDLGNGIEIIQDRHRYAIVWPSIHPSGGRYVWSHPEHGVIGDASLPLDAWVERGVPAAVELAELPASWVQGLTDGREALTIAAADLEDGEALQWLSTHGRGSTCRSMTHAVDGYVQELASGARSRHEVIKDATMRICHMVAEGHRGGAQAAGAVRDAFQRAMVGDAREAEAPGEWHRLILGAVRIAAADTLEDADPCDNPFAGLLERAPASPAQLLGPTTPTPAPQAAQLEPDATEADLRELAGLPAQTMAVQPQEDDGPASSWSPIDLTQYLDGTWEPEQPTILQRSDGHHLIYPGLVHDIHGESESGKSLIAQIMAAEEMMAGQEVVYLDFESSAAALATRMLSLGCSPDMIRDLFIYVRPEVNPYALSELEAFKQLLERRPALVVLDGVTDALAISGASSTDNDDITKWHRAIPRAIAIRTGAAVVMIDHVVKSAETRGRFAIGGQAKLATVDGASYSAEIKEPIGKGLRGKVLLRIGKDRPGSIRPNCGRWRSSDRSQEAAEIVIDSTEDHNRIHWTILPPTSSVKAQDMGEGASVPAPDVEEITRAAMERVSRRLETLPHGESATACYQGLKDAGLGLRKGTVLEAFGRLREGGYVVGGQGSGKAAQPLLSKTPYRCHNDPESERYRGGAGGGFEDLVGNDYVTEQTLGI